MRPEKLLLVALIGLIAMYAVLRSEAHENDQIKLSLKNRAGNAISSLTDGDVVKLNVVLTNAASQTTEVTFELAPGNKPIGKCTVPSARRRANPKAYKRSVGSGAKAARACQHARSARFRR